MELLFESRSNLSQFLGTLHFVQWQPEVHQEAVISPDTFVDRRAVSAYGTVLNEDGKLKMWYQATPEDWPGTGDIAAVAYAESEDGYNWKKRPLGIVEHGPEANHLCNLGLHCPSVFSDPSDPPSHRYRATGCGREGFLARPGLRYGYYTAHSADGLHWELDSPQPQWEGGDVITNIYHPGRKSGLIALKKQPWINRMVRRSIHTAQYRQGQYSEHVSALYPDEYTDVAAMQRGFFSGDYYGMAMMAAGQGTVGFVWNFLHDLPYSKTTPLGVHGHSNISLVFQELEGDRWLHMPGRPDFISHRDVPWSGGGWIYSTSSPVTVGDEQRLYFSACNWEHGQFRFEGKPVPHWTDWLEQNRMSGMTFARWPKHRLFGFKTPRDASFTIELTDQYEPFTVCLNYKSCKGGKVLASITGDDRYAVAESAVLAGDEIAATLSWKNGSVIHPPENGKVFLTLHLEMAAVYAYEVVKAV